ncbi:MAG: hypothetical protein ACRERS_10115 [Methylococcales bacterium]
MAGALFQSGLNAKLRLDRLEGISGVFQDPQELFAGVQASFHESIVVHCAEFRSTRNMQ